MESQKFFLAIEDKIGSSETVLGKTTVICTDTESEAPAKSTTVSVMK